MSVPEEDDWAAARWRVSWAEFLCQILFEQKDVAAIGKKKKKTADLWEAARGGSTSLWG